MSEGQIIEDNEPRVPQRTTFGRRYPWAMPVVALLFVIAAFLSWYGTWFGRPLSDSQVESYLSDTEKPRNVQHALEQIVERISQGDQSVKRWYPKIASLTKHPVAQVRQSAAWAMGHDNSSEEFHRALLSMLEDPDPVARYNAALWLVRFGDAAGRPELVAMLQPHVLRASSEGTVELFIRQEAVAVAAGAPLARIRAGGEIIEIHAPEDGRIELLAVSNGQSVQVGDELIVLSPGIKQVENALTALAYVGQTDDIPYIQRYTRPIPSMPDYIQEQARAALEAIRARGATGRMDGPQR